jgi:hypothetical protein
MMANRKMTEKTDLGPPTLSQKAYSDRARRSKDGLCESFNTIESNPAIETATTYKTVSSQTVRSKAPALGTLQMLVARRATMPVTAYEMASAGLVKNGLRIRLPSRRAANPE